MTRDSGFFTESLASRDPEISRAIGLELGRQREEIELTEPPQEESTDSPKPVCPHAAPESWPNEPAEMPPKEPGKTVIDEVADTADLTEDSEETDEEGGRS